MERYQTKAIIKDLETKYVFLAGPRQAGKTTLAKQIATQNLQYLNYDLAEDRRIIINGQWNRLAALVVLDEFHKHPKWKTFLKGYYDKEGVHPPILVTGSAKLNVFRKGNDSMVGRHYYHRLLPLSVKELNLIGSGQNALSKLLQFGNFPEPFLASSDEFTSRWEHSYLERLVREDVNDLKNIQSLSKIQLLIDLLRERVGSSISYSSLAEDLEVAPKTVKEWLTILEQLYIIFKVPPYSKNLARSLLKESKYYFYNCRMAFNAEAHLENLVAVSLLKHLNYQEDNLGIKGELYYLRTKDGQEIDFLTLQNRKIVDLVEVKHTDHNLSKSFNYFHKHLESARSQQIVLNLREPKTVGQTQITSVEEFLLKLDI